MDSRIILALATDRFYMLFLTRLLSTIFTYVKKRERQTYIMWQMMDIIQSDPNTRKWGTLASHGSPSFELQSYTEPTHE